MSTTDFSKILDEIPPSGIRRFFDLVIGRKDILSLGVGEPDFTTPWHIRETGIFSLENGITSYTSNRGLDELRVEIGHYMKRQFGVSYDPATEMVITVGVSEGVDITLRAILNAGDEVIIPQPAYVCYDPLVKLAGGVVKSIDTSADEFVTTAAQIEKAITKKTKALVLCSPNNPTGRVIPKAELKKIAALAKKHDFWVISDEIYAELTYDQEYTSFAALPGAKERTILMNGFSKAFAMTGWRIGYICAPEAVVSRALKIHQYSILCAPILGQYAAIEALKNGEKEVNEMTASYQRRRNFFVGGLRKIGFPVPDCEGAFYCFPEIRFTGLSSEEFAMKLLESQKVAVVPGTAFGDCGEGHIRCCYAASMENLQEALKRIERFIESL